MLTQSISTTVIAGKVSPAALPAQAQSLKPDEVFSSIAVRTIADPDPVLGADGRTHLAYELFVTNPSKVFVTLDKVDGRWLISQFDPV